MLMMMIIGMLGEGMSQYPMLLDAFLALVNFVDITLFWWVS